MEHSQVFSSNDTGCRQTEGPLYPDEKSDEAKYDDYKIKKNKINKKKRKIIVRVHQIDISVDLS